MKQYLAPTSYCVSKSIVDKDNLTLVDIIKILAGVGADILLWMLVILTLAISVPIALILLVLLFVIVIIYLIVVIIIYIIAIILGCLSCGIINLSPIIKCTCCPCFCLQALLIFMGVEESQI